MKKSKQNCHVCGHTMKTKKDQDPAQNCERCQADLTNPEAEMLKEATAVADGAGGVKADVVHIYLTSKRFVFIADNSDIGAGGGLIGGIIGGVVSAVRESKNTNFASYERSEIASVSDEITGLLKNKVILTITAKDGETYSMTLSKKDAERFKNELA